MTDLESLKVSLTKHGAHKIAALLRAFPKDQVLDNTWGRYRGIKIDRTQAAKNLSADENDVLPDVWDQVRQLGDRETDNLVLVAVIFSHHQLITAMKKSRAGRMQGKLVRGQVLYGKAYTNAAHILVELGFSAGHVYPHVAYDLRCLFTNERFPSLVRELLSLKLRSAGWLGDNDPADECVRLGFHDVFALSVDDFSKWLSGNPIDPYATDDLDESIDAEIEPFRFICGHQARAEGVVSATTAQGPTTARLLHNEMQTGLFEYLAGIYGEESVGTEHPCGLGYVDVVLSQDDGFTFYELKTDTSIRSCIRQAVGQLMDYAYWPDEKRAQALIIVSPNPASAHARSYLKHLRSEFGLPVFYQQLDLRTVTLGDRC